MVMPVFFRALLSVTNVSKQKYAEVLITIHPRTMRTSRKRASRQLLEDSNYANDEVALSDQWKGSRGD